MGVVFIPREEFVREYWDYQPGEHVSFIEPTQQGKSYLAYQLLEETVRRYPELSTVTLVPKPRDPATAMWCERIGLKEIPEWPPPYRVPWKERPAGYALWPRHLKDAPKDEARAHLAKVFRKCLSEQYWKGDSITFADDVYIAAVMLKLNMDFEEFWTAGSAMGAGLWSANQKPTGTIGGGSVSTFSYNSPSHLFLGSDPDARNRQRFGEIGGVDPKQIEYEVRRLKVHHINGKNVSEKLYISKAGPYLAIVGV